MSLTSIDGTPCSRRWGATMHQCGRTGLSPETLLTYHGARTVYVSMYLMYYVLFPRAMTFTVSYYAVNGMGPRGEIVC